MALIKCPECGREISDKAQWCVGYGYGVDKNLHKAIQLYQKAADQGLARAQNNLGILYKEGSGVKKDLQKAAELFRKAADSGNELAKENLAKIQKYL